MSTADLVLSSASASSKPALPPISAKTEAAAAKAAKDFEAVFLNEYIGAMFEGIKTDGPFGGGPGEGMFRSMMIDQYSRTLSNQGGIGLAASVKSEILRMQEHAA